MLGTRCLVEPDVGKMRRTQITLEPELVKALDRLAERRGTSRASLLREAARKLVASETPIEDDPLFAIIGMGDSSKRERVDPDDDPIFGIIGIADCGPSDVSVRHDDYLIEAEMEKWTR